MKTPGLEAVDRERIADYLRMVRAERASITSPVLHRLVSARVQRRTGWVIAALTTLRGGVYPDNVKVLDDLLDEAHLIADLVCHALTVGRYTEALQQAAMHEGLRALHHALIALPSSRPSDQTGLCGTDGATVAPPDLGRKGGLSPSEAP